MYAVLAALDVIFDTACLLESIPWFCLWCSKRDRPETRRYDGGTPWKTATSETERSPAAGAESAQQSRLAVLCSPEEYCGQFGRYARQRRCLACSHRVPWLRCGDYYDREATDGGKNLVYGLL
ncbi:hypothetical protein PsYK624_153000 [Phanerochaete sordida]|uniref:Uncharacterized protein n=1 Tax=Phanerochaete sordida TaxID=48140 RepID=A0A9P3GT10_9APHY|nr:hypothetical protein PsYK624_153000 [Phanerochaete sordida]